jgi:hypothetical protein
VQQILRRNQEQPPVQPWSKVELLKADNEIRSLHSTQISWTDLSCFAFQWQEAAKLEAVCCIILILTGTYSYAILVSSLEVFRIFSDKGTGGGPCVDVWMVTLSWPNLRKSSRYFWREFYVYNDEGRTSIAAEAVVLFCFFLCTGDFGGNYRADQENIE